MALWRRRRLHLRFGANIFLVVFLLMAGAMGCWAQGAVWAWGANSAGQLGNNTTHEQDSPVQSFNLAHSGPLTSVISVSAGSMHSLALLSNGTVLAWGDDNYGELGNGAVLTTPQKTPVQVVGPGGSGMLSGITSIAAGPLYSLALRNDGTVWAWGYNSYSQLGLGLPSILEDTPMQVVGPAGAGFLTDVVAISAGVQHALALRRNGTVWAWGTNGAGQLGISNTEPSAFPVQVLSANDKSVLQGIIAIAAGDQFSVALKSDGTVWAWGDNQYGELGDGVLLGGYNYQDSYIPVQVVGPNATVALLNITAIAAGRHHVLALKNDSTVWAWGDNQYGEIGDGTDYTRYAPVQVLGSNTNGILSGVITLAGGDGHSMVLANDGTVYAWGRNDAGQLGSGTDDDYFHPTPMQLAAQPIRVVGIADANAGANSLAITGYQLLWQNIATGDTYQWVANNATIVASAEMQAGVPNEWRIVGSANFSGDTTPDILWQDTVTGEVGYWQMDGGAVYDYIQIMPPGAIPPGWMIVGAADITGGGYPEILWQNMMNGEVGYWTLSDSVVTGFVQVLAPGAIAPGWHIVGTPDLFGTGSPELLWQNVTTGEVGYGPMSAGRLTGYTQLLSPNVLPLSWQIVATPEIVGTDGSNIVWQNMATNEVGYWTLSNGQPTGYVQLLPPGKLTSGWQLRGAL